MKFESSKRSYKVVSGVYPLIVRHVVRLLTTLAIEITRLRGVGRQ